MLMRILGFVLETLFFVLVGAALLVWIGIAAVDRLHRRDVRQIGVELEARRGLWAGEEADVAKREAGLAFDQCRMSFDGGTSCRSLHRARTSVSIKYRSMTSPCAISLRSLVWSTQSRERACAY